MFFVGPLLLMTASIAFVWLWAVRTFPWLGARRRPVAAAAASFLAAMVVSGRAVVYWHVGSTLHTVCVVAAMALSIAALPIGAMHALGWALDRARRARPAEVLPATPAHALMPALRPSPAPTAGMSRRQVVEAVGGAAFLGATGTMLGWGMVRGRHAFEIRELPVRIAALPRALDGYVIAQISDIHTGTYVGERELGEGLARVRAARPDLVVVTGDLVDFDPAYASLVARKLGDLATRDGVVAILGNHDYYAGAPAVLDALRRTGVTSLVDEGRVVRPGDGGGFALLGVDDLRARRYGGHGPRLDRALATVPPALPRILLSHQPPTIQRWAGRVALQLSGHTHGGQINPGFRPADMFLPYVAGEYRVGGTVLYVNRGFGTVGPPARVGAPPEVTRIVLVAA